ncbi:MAG: DUF6615 family protein [Ferruginibacter sp.]
MNHLIFSQKDRYRQLTLCDDFKEIALRTWHLMRNAYEFDMGIGEETITDINLLELKIRQPDLVFTKKMSRRAEHRIGADWLWAIVGRTGATFILYVQAKKFFPETGRYNSLIERVHPFQQVDKLISNQFFYSLFGINMYPIYVFYNYFEGHTHGINCNCGVSMNKKLSGCSYADAIEVRSRIVAHQDSFDDLYPIQYAWSCLVCCGGGGSATRGTDLARSFFDSIVDTQKLNAFMRERNNIDFSASNLVTEKPPEFVEQVISGDQINEEIFTDLNIGEIVVFDERKFYE